MEVKPGFKQTEVGVIPEDWDVKPLSLVAIYTNGKAHERSISDLGKYIVVNSKFISTNGNVKKYSDFRFSPASKGEILMVMSDVPNGRAIARCFFVDRDDLYTVNQRICIVRPLQVNERFLIYKLDRHPYYLAFDDGVKQTNLRKDYVLSCPLALPPTKAEQEAIAEALSDADTLIESLEQLVVKKRHIKQGAMQELLTGNKRLLGFTEAWATKQFGDVVDIQKGELITEKNAVPGPIPVVAGGKKPAYFHNRANRFRKTITISGSGASAGYVAFYDGPIFASDCSTIGEGANYAVEFIYFVLLLNQSAIYQAQTGGAQPHIHPNDLRPLAIALPATRAEQAAIAAILSDMDAEIAALEGKLAKARQLKQDMMQELLSGRIRLV